MRDVHGEFGLINLPKWPILCRVGR